MLRKLQILYEKRMNIPSEIQDDIANVYPISGYIFLCFTFFFAYPKILIPLKLFNPEWEFQTITQIINSVWTPFIGFALIFFTRKYNISFLEKKFLGLLSWLTLLLGIMFFIFLPLILGDAHRITVNLQSQFDRINEQQVAQVQQIEKRFQEATPTELENFFKLQGESEKTANLSLQEKTDVYLATVKAQRRAAYDANKSELAKKQRKVKQDSFLLSIGAVLGSILLINVWFFARWTRRGL